jgi:hypothetical protein
MVKLGYIYEIRSSNTDKCYIGSTFQQDLNKRLNQHKIHYKSYNSGKRGYITSFEVVKFNDSIINLLSTVECDNKKQLNRKEGQFICLMKDNIFNKRIEGRTEDETRIHVYNYQVDYRNNNREYLNNRQKEKIDCACGKKYMRVNKLQHLKSLKCKKYHDELNINVA